MWKTFVRENIVILNKIETSDIKHHLVVLGCLKMNWNSSTKCSEHLPDQGEKMFNKRFTGERRV